MTDPKPNPQAATPSSGRDAGAPSSSSGQNRVPLDVSWDSTESTVLKRFPDEDAITEVAAPLSARTPKDLVPGMRVGDFDLIKIVGEGSFGRVFLARQMSLGRMVAVKVTGQVGSEAQTLASLEHDHIVQVFSETVDEVQGLRFLCMQFIAGTTLERVIQEFRFHPPDKRSGRLLLDVVDRLSTQQAVFHPAALRDREQLSKLDGEQAACWLCSHLAEALDYAHGRGILHRDIKPANVLLSAYGRPYLADFNLAMNSEDAQAQGVGGTANYMSPEHLDAFNPMLPTTAREVDARSDIFSLGVVLHELVTGERPWQTRFSSESFPQRLTIMSRQRREALPPLNQRNPLASPVLDRLVRKCLDPLPAKRYQNAADLAADLNGTQVWCDIQKQLPNGLAEWLIVRRPLTALLVLTLAPQVLGSAINITYNLSQIVSFLPPRQQAAFQHLIPIYNGAMYPLCVLGLVAVGWPVISVWRRLVASRSPLVTETEIVEARRRLCRWPLWAAALSAVGWLPGALIFPLGIDALAGPVSREMYAHFAISLVTSGLVAMTYSFFGVELMVLRVFYPQFWVSPREIRLRATQELAGTRWQIRAFQFCAGVIPLLGACLMLAVGPEAFGSTSFRALVGLLILLGMAGFGSALSVGTLMTETIAALTGRTRD